MLKIIWLLIILLFVYMTVILIKNKLVPELTSSNRFSSLVKGDGLVRVIHPEVRVNANTSVTIIEIGEKQYSIIQSQNGITTVDVNVDVKGLEDRWNEEQGKGAYKQRVANGGSAFLNKAKKYLPGTKRPEVKDNER